MKKKLYLVDISSFIFRAFYAIRPLTNPAGLPTNALYGFVSMTVKLLREIHPDYMAFAFDTAKATFRRELDPRYKANRTEMPEELVPQMPYFRKLAEALGIPCLAQEGFEADDIIGTLTRLGREHDLEVVIVSSDKDFAQLLAPHVSMYDTMKDIRIDAQAARERWGVEPRKMIDYLSIVGDSSDNIKGVAGIGPKGAEKLLSEFESLEDIYQNIAKITPAGIQKKLEASRDEAFLAKKLVTIVCDMPLGVQPEDLKLKPMRREDLTALLTELDFKSFARTLLGDSSGVIGADEKSVSHVLNPEKKDSSPSSETKATAKPHTTLMPTVDIRSIELGPIREERYDLGALQKWLVPRIDTWVIQSEHVAHIAQVNPGGPGYTIAEIAADGKDLGKMLSEKNLRLKGFDLKSFGKTHQISKFNPMWDQMLAAYIVRAGPIESLSPLFELYNGEALPDLASPAQMLTAQIRLETQLRRQLAQVGGERVLFEIEQPLIPILMEMEQTGVLLDLKKLSEQSAGLAKDMAVLEKEIHQLAGEEFNIGSPKQLGQILFEKLKMPSGKKTKTGFSTGEEVLAKLTEYPIAQKILQWRELTKLKSTYVDALPQLVNKDTGRVHTTFNQAHTATGRLSSMNPNLQNIPIRSERGNAIRKAFIADPKHVLISADYSQIELRVLAHITGDTGLVRAFENNLDVHAATASEVFEVPLSEVTQEMRRKAKAVNFGLAYGQGAFGLAETLGIPRGEASEIVSRYFTRFPGVKTYMTDTVEEAKKRGFVETIFGRRRYLNELQSDNGMMRKFGERAAINAPIQGAASDIVKLAMIKVGHPSGTRMLLQVHDELVFEVAEKKADEVCLAVAAKMEGVTQLRVPLRVNTGVGHDWQDAHS